ncbi:MAG: hypothetical protein HYX63_21790 [Gammaproteobacteria bacterium]|nr:hypothetical protein [Gammaproteobacteria bacterium]
MNLLPMSQAEPPGAIVGAVEGGQSTPIGGLLNSFLDSNKNGSIVDDVLGMLFKR